MDYEYVERLQEEINWVLEAADLSKVSGRQTIPVTLGSETREVMLESLRYTIELLTRVTLRDKDDYDLARMVAMTIGGIELNEPESSTWQPVSIARFHLKVVGDSAEVQVLWDVGNRELETRVHTNNEFTKRDRLNVFSLLRNRIERMFDNLAGLKDYTADFDLVNKVYQINFN